MHPQVELLLVLTDLFPGWSFLISEDGVWIARSKQGRPTVSGSNIDELLDALYRADPSARDRIADLLGTDQPHADASVERHPHGTGARSRAVGQESAPCRDGSAALGAVRAGMVISSVLAVLGARMIWRRLAGGEGCRR